MTRHQGLPPPAASRPAASPASHRPSARLCSRSLA